MPDKALSIKQPWAWLICAEYKDIENRDWRIGRRTSSGAYGDFSVTLPQRIYVHAGKTNDLQEHFAAWEILMSIYGPPSTSLFDVPKYKMIIADCKKQEQFGAIIGEVTVTGCVEKSDSPWFVGKYGFTLADPVLYDKPIPYRGQLGFFEVKRDAPEQQ
jgi:hypothetical protein